MPLRESGQVPSARDASDQVVSSDEHEAITVLGSGFTASGFRVQDLLHEPVTYVQLVGHSRTNRAEDRTPLPWCEALPTTGSACGIGQADINGRNTSQSVGRLSV